MHDTKQQPIELTRPSLPDMTEYIEEIKDLWESRFLTNMGVKHRQFATALSEKLGARVALFTNGHLALEAVLAAFDLRGEVITTPFTFASTTHAIVRSGLEPVFCDVDPATGLLDPARIEALITNRTSAILPVHVYGQACDTDAIDSIARRYGLKVIYDAAHAFGVSVGDRPIGSFGDASVFSFHATKVFQTAEGGAVTGRDPILFDRLDLLKNFGITGPESVVCCGGNAKMNEFQAALGLCNLRHINDEIRLRELLVSRYHTWLFAVPGIRLLPIQPDVRSNYAYFPVFFHAGHEARDAVYLELRRQGINCRKYFYPLTSSFACYAGRFDLIQTPAAQALAGQVLCLPLYPDLPNADIDRICAVVREVRLTR
ncbi:MAG: DegT/DnrJ/EryC1/StrS family aminotransferase [Bacillota bacterium]|nr:DegT/DnrJ/EryC1/StrS family aminotransferase [Bacillota bacterium]